MVDVSGNDTTSISNLTIVLIVQSNYCRDCVSLIDLSIANNLEDVSVKFSVSLMDLNMSSSGVIFSDNASTSDSILTKLLTTSGDSDRLTFSLTHPIISMS